MEIFNALTKLDSTSIIFGGLTLIALATVVVLSRVINHIINKHAETDKLYFNHTNDVIKANTNSQLISSVVNQKLVDAIDHNSQIIEKYHSKQ